MFEPSIPRSAIPRAAEDAVGCADAERQIRDGGAVVEELLDALGLQLAADSAVMLKRHVLDGFGALGRGDQDFVEPLAASSAGGC